MIIFTGRIIGGGRYTGLCLLFKLTNATLAAFPHANTCRETVPLVLKTKALLWLLSCEQSILCILQKKNRTHFWPISANFKVLNREFSSNLLVEIETHKELQQHQVIIASSPATKQSHSQRFHRCLPVQEAVMALRFVASKDWSGSSSLLEENPALQSLWLWEQYWFCFRAPSERHKYQMKNYLCVKAFQSIARDTVWCMDNSHTYTAKLICKAESGRKGNGNMKSVLQRRKKGGYWGIQLCTLTQSSTQPVKTFLLSPAWLAPEFQPSLLFC